MIRRIVGVHVLVETLDDVAEAVDVLHGRAGLQPLRERVDRRQVFRRAHTLRLARLQRKRRCIRTRQMLDTEIDPLPDRHGLGKVFVVPIIHL